MKKSIFYRLPTILSEVALAFVVFVFMGGGANYDYIKVYGCHGTGCYIGGTYRFKTNWYGCAFEGYDVLAGFITMTITLLALIAFVVFEIIWMKKTISRKNALTTTILSIVLWPFVLTGAIFNDACSYYSSATFMIVMGYFAVLSVAAYCVLNVLRLNQMKKDQIA